MATNRKIDRALRGPGPVEIVLSIILSLILGVLLGAAHLAFKPVKVVKKAEEATEVRTVYFIEGSNSSAKSRQWTRKRQMLVSGTPAQISFNEDELNAWSDSALVEVTGGAAKQGRTLKANFRIQNGVINAGLIATEGKSTSCWIHVKGTFVAQGENPKAFFAEEIYLGSLPLHSILPPLRGMFLESVLNAKDTPEEARALWQKIKSASVEDTVLKLTVE